MAEAYLLRVYREAREREKRYATVERRGRYIEVKVEIPPPGLVSRVTVTSKRGGFISVYLLSPRTTRYINKKLAWIAVPGHPSRVVFDFPLSGVDVRVYGYPKEWYYIVTLWDRPGGRIIEQIKPIPAVPPLVRERAPPPVKVPQALDIIARYRELVELVKRRRGEAEERLKKLKEVVERLKRLIKEAEEKGELEKAERLRRTLRRVEEEVERVERLIEENKSIWTAYKEELERAVREALRRGAPPRQVEKVARERVAPPERVGVPAWERVKLFLYENWKWIALAAAGAGVGAVAYLVYRWARR